jgi:hypothetical protein
MRTIPTDFTRNLLAAATFNCVEVPLRHFALEVVPRSTLDLRAELILLESNNGILLFVLAGLIRWDIPCSNLPMPENPKNPRRGQRPRLPKAASL